jgi:hypothetical protein
MIFVSRKRASGVAMTAGLVGQILLLPILILYRNLGLGEGQ